MSKQRIRPDYWITPIFQKPYQIRDFSAEAPEYPAVIFLSGADAERIKRAVDFISQPFWGHPKTLPEVSFCPSFHRANGALYALDDGEFSHFGWAEIGLTIHNGPGEAARVSVVDWLADETDFDFSEDAYFGSVSEVLKEISAGLVSAPIGVKMHDDEFGEHTIFLDKNGVPFGDGALVKILEAARATVR